MEENKGIDKPKNEVTFPPAFTFKEAKEIINTKMKDSTGFTFPKEFSTIVWVRRKTQISLPRTGEFLDESIMKIGSSFKGNSTLRGLNFEEESRFLPQIIGVSPKSDNWEKATFDYWANISKPVPPGEKDGSGGLKLEVGLRYLNEEDYLADKKKKVENGAIINPIGTPINISDYILWRYCLVYSKIANNKEDINKSANIDFYLYSKDREVKEQKASLEQKRKASQLLYQNLADRNWVEFMLRLLIRTDQSPLYSIKDLQSVSEDEKDVLLEKYMQDKPSVFSAYAEDKNLEIKSFIEVCIAIGTLTRIANTNSISFDGVTIGNTIDETVTYLNNPKNSQVIAQLRANSQVKPS